LIRDFFMPPKVVGLRKVKALYERLPDDVRAEIAATWPD
jgi:hypothetical protein